MLTYAERHGCVSVRSGLGHMPPQACFVKRDPEHDQLAVTAHRFRALQPQSHSEHLEEFAAVYSLSDRSEEVDWQHCNNPEEIEQHPSHPLSQNEFCKCEFIKGSLEAAVSV